MLVVGRRPVLEVLSARGREIRHLWLAEGAHGAGLQEIVTLARQAGVPFRWAPRQHLDRLLRQHAGGLPSKSSGVLHTGSLVLGHHQGVIAEIAPIAIQELDQWLPRVQQMTNPLVLLLDELTSPDNLGHILRSAAGFGVQGVILPRWRSVGVTPTVMKISSGAAEHVPILSVTNLNQASDQLKEAGFWLIGADPTGRPCWTVDLHRPLALAIGSEGKGLRPSLKAHCDDLLGVPLPGKVASLNAATATAILLYEICRQRSSTGRVAAL